MVEERVLHALHTHPEVTRIAPDLIMLAALTLLIVMRVLSPEDALAGLGNSPFHPVDFTILNKRVSQSRLGHAFSVHGITGNLGWALAPVFLAGLTAATGSWRWAAAAIIAALSVQSASGGKTISPPRAATAAVIRARSLEFAETPPATVSRGTSRCAIARVQRSTRTSTMAS